jgi:dCTP deaminase
VFPCIVTDTNRRAHLHDSSPAQEKILFFEYPKIETEYPLLGHTFIGHVAHPPAGSPRQLFSGRLRRNTPFFKHSRVKCILRAGFLQDGAELRTPAFLFSEQTFTAIFSAPKLVLLSSRFPTGGALMPVIPLVIGGSHPTVVEREDQFNYNSGAMLILNLDKDQLQGNQSNASYDLRIGRAYKDHREQERWSLAKGGEITLLPGGAILIETEEEIWLPHGMFGFIVPKVGLLQDGVSNTLSKVDPGYHGHLVVTVFNLGKKEIPLKQGSPFCALVVHDVGSGIKPFTGSGKTIEGRTGVGLFLRWWDRIEARPAVLGLISLVLSLALVIGELLIHLSISKHPSAPEQNPPKVERDQK